MATSAFSKRNCPPQEAVGVIKYSGVHRVLGLKLEEENERKGWRRE